jgi:hypothetical protein
MLSDLVWLAMENILNERVRVESSFRASSQRIIIGSRSQRAIPQRKPAFCCERVFYCGMSQPVSAYFGLRLLHNNERWGGQEILIKNDTFCLLP